MQIQEATTSLAPRAQPHAGLYAELLGAGWGGIPDCVRRVHSQGATSQGTLEVLRSRSWLGRLLGWLLRMPPASPATAVALCLDGEGTLQVWRRRFGSVSLISKQFGESGRLIETYGPVALCFELRPLSDGLELQLTGVRLQLWTRRLPLPRWCSPRVSGSARAEGDQARVDVCIEAPLVGLLLRYRGLVRALERA
ncbi:MAG: DUF4166 domain-containing protein [Myxococcales bacterium]